MSMPFTCPFYMDGHSTFSIPSQVPFIWIVIPCIAVPITGPFCTDGYVIHVNTIGMYV